VKHVLGEQHAKKMDQISLSVFTAKGSISEMSEDILDEVVAEMKNLSQLCNSVGRINRRLQ
jgi:hypothetical protein